MPPDFGDAEYWNARFLTEEKPFEWLEDPSDFLPFIQKRLSSVPEDSPSILHFGPGSSTLSLRLRGLVSEPSQVHNVDYSQAAIDRGRAMEARIFDDDKDRTMRWTCIDLVDPRSISALLENDLFGPEYSLIVDKSSTDAVACGPDPIMHPLLFKSDAMEHGLGLPNTDVYLGGRKVHPVTLLALHLALISVPGAYWLCLSYSRDRFPFFSDGEASTKTIEWLNPSIYWTLEQVDQVPLEETDDGNDLHIDPVQRPKMTNWLYTLKRTARDLALSNH